MFAAARMKAKTKPAIVPDEMGKRIFYLMRNGSILDSRILGKKTLSPKQLEDVVKWCVEGGQWTPAKQSHPPRISVTVWKCQNFLCPRPRLWGYVVEPCPWWIDSNLRVWCGRMNLRGYGPAIYSGPADDPPFVIASCEITAARPITLKSGKALG